MIDVFFLLFSRSKPKTEAWTNYFHSCTVRRVGSTVSKDTLPRYIHARGGGHENRVAWVQSSGRLHCVNCFLYFLILGKWLFHEMRFKKICRNQLGKLSVVVPPIRQKMWGSFPLECLEYSFIETVLLVPSLYTRGCVIGGPLAIILASRPANVALCSRFNFCLCLKIYSQCIHSPLVVIRSHVLFTVTDPHCCSNVRKWLANEKSFTSRVLTF